MRLSFTVTGIWRLKYWTHGRGHGKKNVRREKEKRGREKEEKGKVEKEKEETYLL